MQNGNCLECDNCIPIGEGDHFCDIVMDVVLDDYQPTIHYGGCVKNSVVVKPKKSNVKKKNLIKIVTETDKKIRLKALIS